MRRRIIALCMVLVLCTMCTLSVSAADTPLLSAEKTRLLSEDGNFTYTPDKALELTAEGKTGVTAAVELNMTVNVYETPFVQLSLTSTAAFNIAFKLGGGEQDIFPQTAGPSWYEGFQERIPASGDGVDAGSYTLSLSLPAYIEYNDLVVPENGEVTLKTVYVMLKSAGNLTLEHLVLSENGKFQTASGKTGKTAFSPIAVTTAEKGTTPTTVPSYNTDGMIRFQSNDFPVGVVVLLLLAAVLVAVMMLMSIKKQKK